MLSEFLQNGNLSAFLSPSITPIIALTPPDRKEEQLSLFLKSGNLVNFLQSKREIVTIEKPVPEKSPLEILKNEKYKLENDLKKLKEEIVSLNNNFEKKEKNLEEEKTQNKLQQQRIEELQKEIDLKKLELNKLQSPTPSGNLSFPSQPTNTSEQPNILSSNGEQPLPPPSSSGPPPPPPPPPPPLQQKSQNENSKPNFGEGIRNYFSGMTTMTSNSTEETAQPTQEKETNKVDGKKNKEFMILYMQKIISNTDYGKKLEIPVTTISNDFNGATSLEEHLSKISSSEIANNFLNYNRESLLSVKEALGLATSDFTGINKLGSINGLIFNVLDYNPEQNPSNDTSSQQKDDDENDAQRTKTLNSLLEKCNEIFTFKTTKITQKLIVSFDNDLKKKTEYELSIEKKEKIISQFSSLVTDETLCKILAVVMVYFTIESNVKVFTKFKPLSSCFQFFKTAGRLRLFYLNHKEECDLMIKLHEAHKNLKIDEGDLKLITSTPGNEKFEILSAEIKTLKEKETKIVSNLYKLFELFSNNFRNAIIDYFKVREGTISEEEKPPANLFDNFTLGNKGEVFLEEFIKSLYNIINLPWTKESTKCGVNILAQDNVEVMQCNAEIPKYLDKGQSACIDQFNAANKLLFENNHIKVLKKPCNS